MSTAAPTATPVRGWMATLPEDTTETCDKHPSAKAQVTWYLASSRVLTLCGNCARKNGYKGWGKSLCSSSQYWTSSGASCSS